MEPFAIPATEPIRVPSALSVAQVVTQIRALIESRFPAPLWVEGELSNCSFPASGHIYFSLVDERGTDRFGQRLLLPCAFYRGSNQHLKFRPADGMKVLCLGQLTTYERQGQYQLRVLRVEPKGIGALQLAFEQLKKRLAAEGLFDEARKRPIPKTPECIGVITSPSGSAVHDIVSKLRNFFHVIVIPTKVQGDGASEEIAHALDTANRRHLADVLIVGRGGGSVEDLWAFNEEGVARAIVRSRIPVISAVGHQDDWTIADYVSDLRASTPTDAAKRLVEEKERLFLSVQSQYQHLLDATRGYLSEQTFQLDGFCSRLRLLHPAIQLGRLQDKVQQLQDELAGSMRHTLDVFQHSLEGLAGRMQALSPLAVLGRGYSITLRLPDRHVVTAAKDVKEGDTLETLLAQGRLLSTVQKRSETG